MEMSDRSWRKLSKIGLVITIFLTVVAAGWMVYNAQKQQQTIYKQTLSKAESYNSNANKAIVEACVRANSVSESTCSREILDAAREQQRREYDLYSQRAMAIWTEVMGQMAILGVALSTIGVYLIWRTFRETQFAASAANATHQSFIASERAVLKIKSAATREVDKQDPNKLRFNLKIVNNGRSNAVCSELHWTVTSDRTYPVHFEVKNVGKFYDTRAEDWGSAILIEVPEEYPIYVIGHIEYRTLVSLSYRTFFCYEITETGEDRRYGGASHYTRSVDCEKLPEDT